MWLPLVLLPNDKAVAELAFTLSCMDSPSQMAVLETRLKVDMGQIFVLKM